MAFTLERMLSDLQTYSENTTNWGNHEAAIKPKAVNEKAKLEEEELENEIEPLVEIIKKDVDEISEEDSLIEEVKSPRTSRGEAF